MNIDYIIAIIFGAIFVGLVGTQIFDAIVGLKILSDYERKNK